MLGKPMRNRPVGVAVTLLVVLAACRGGGVPTPSPAASATGRVLLDGRTAGDFEVGFGQQPERKRRKDDLRTPRGMYFVVEKSRGPFSGPYGAYYGSHWIKVNYPNAHDAAWGRERGLLGRDVERRIAEAWSRRAATWQGSPLGSGIGFHGWIDDWPLDGPRRLSWGCVVMQNRDIAGLFDRIPLGAMVVIL
jgi:hypothetical protein